MWLNSGLSNRFPFTDTFHYGHTDAILVEILHWSDYHVKSCVLFSALKAQSEVSTPAGAETPESGSAGLVGI